MMRFGKSVIALMFLHEAMEQLRGMSLHLSSKCLTRSEPDALD
jgi:hypothetical protein